MASVGTLMMSVTGMKAASAAKAELKISNIPSVSINTDKIAIFLLLRFIS
jgi:hypothetical protein